MDECLPAERQGFYHSLKILKQVKGRRNLIWYACEGNIWKEGTVCYLQRIVFGFRFWAVWSLLIPPPELAKLHMIWYVRRPSRSISSCIEKGIDSPYRVVVMNWAAYLESAMNPLSFCQFLMGPVEELEAWVENPRITSVVGALSPRRSQCFYRNTAISDIWIY